MIYGDIYVIGIQLELVAIYDTIKCGIFNFVIDGKLFPGEGIIVEFYPTIEDLQDRLQFGLERGGPDLGAIPLEQIDFLSADDHPGTMYLGGGLIADFGFCCCLGFDGNDDRFFYSMDYGKTYQEQRYPRGTIERLIRSLPTDDEIEFCNKESIRVYGYPLAGKSDRRYRSTLPPLKGSHQGELDKFANEYLTCQHGMAPPNEEADPDDRPVNDVILSRKWCREFGWPKSDLPLADPPLACLPPIAPEGRIDFYQEVEIISEKTIEEAYQDYIGRKGVVLGISKAEDRVYGYGVYFRDGKQDDFLTFTPEEVVPTGAYFKREEFYDGSCACISSVDEILKLHVAGVSNPYDFYITYVQIDEQIDEQSG